MNKKTLFSYLKCLRPETGTWFKGTPACCPAMHAIHAHVLRGQTNGTDVRCKVDGSVQSYHSHIIPVSLGCELEVGMYLDFGGAISAT